MLGADEAMRSFSLFAHEELDQKDYSIRTQIESCTTVQESDTYTESTYGNSRVGQYGFLDESMGLPEQSHRNMNYSSNQNRVHQVIGLSNGVCAMAGRSEVSSTGGMNQQETTYALSTSDRMMCVEAAAMARRNLGITERDLYDGARFSFDVEMLSASSTGTQTRGSTIPDFTTGGNTFPGSHTRRTTFVVGDNEYSVLDTKVTDSELTRMNVFQTTEDAPPSNRMAGMVTTRRRLDGLETTGLFCLSNRMAGLALARKRLDENSNESLEIPDPVFRCSEYLSKDNNLVVQDLYKLGCSHRSRSKRGVSLIYTECERREKSEGSEGSEAQRFENTLSPENSSHESLQSTAQVEGNFLPLNFYPRSFSSHVLTPHSSEKLYPSQHGVWQEANELVFAPIGVPPHSGSECHGKSTHISKYVSTGVVWRIRMGEQETPVNVESNNNNHSGSKSISVYNALNLKPSEGMSICTTELNWKNRSGDQWNLNGAGRIQAWLIEDNRPMQIYDAAKSTVYKPPTRMWGSNFICPIDMIECNKIMWPQEWPATEGMIKRPLNIRCPEVPSLRVKMEWGSDCGDALNALITRGFNVALRGVRSNNFGGDLKFPPVKRLYFLQS